MSLAILFHFLCAQHFSDINIPPSGACDCSVELPHWSCCSWFDVCWTFGVVGLEWYPCCRFYFLSFFLSSFLFLPFLLSFFLPFFLPFSLPFFFLPFFIPLFLCFFVCFFLSSFLFSPFLSFFLSFFLCFFCLFVCFFLAFFLPYSHLFLPTHCRSRGTRSRSVPHTHMVGCLSTNDQPIAALMDPDDGLLSLLRPLFFLNLKCCKKVLLHVKVKISHRLQ